MRRDSLRSLGGTVVAILLYAATVAAAEANLPGPDSTAKQLVDAALASELNGPSDLRPALLKQALERDPNFAPARWQSGYVRYENQWLTLDEVAKRVAADKQLAEYRKRCDALVDTAQNHRELARWCFKNRLREESRIHWAKVLEFEQHDAEALTALDLQVYEGRLLSAQQAKQAKNHAIEQRHALQQWSPKMAKWRKTIERNLPSEVNAAYDAIREISDPMAIPALVRVFGTVGTSQTSEKRNLCVVQTVGQMQHPEATQILIQYALGGAIKCVREAAMDELKKRPLFAFVPQMIALVPEKFNAETHFEVYLLADGTAVHEHFVKLQSPGAVREITVNSVITSPNRTPAAKLQAQLGEADRLEQQVEQQSNQRSREHLIGRIQEVLARTTDFELEGGPESWQRQWDESSESYRYLQPSIMPVVQSEYYWGLRTMSCFPSGTPVLAMSGSTPIEKIKVGDRVLAQNPATGELDYKTVQGVTLRPAVPLVQIHTGSQSVSATRGHPFWVNGEGWLLAKQLKVGQVLHSLAGAVQIDAIDELPAREAYNLVVSDFDSYFVGENHLLVHDNMPLAETEARVPGLNQQATAP